MVSVLAVPQHLQCIACKILSLFRLWHCSVLHVQNASSAALYSATCCNGLPSKPLLPTVTVSERMVSCPFIDRLLATCDMQRGSSGSVVPASRLLCTRAWLRVGQLWLGCFAVTRVSQRCRM